MTRWPGIPWREERSTFSPSERSPIRVIRRVPEESVDARTDSEGCQDREVNVIEFVGRE